MKKILLIICAFVTLPTLFAQTATNINQSPKKMNSNIFKKASWIHNTDVYEVNLRQYTKEGTFNAFLKELPRLKEMGVSTLWFMPITPISEKNKKGSLGSQYACSDYTAINPEFGTLSDFKTLVKKAHSMGLKVIIDWVANHTGWDHVWTKSHPEYFEKDAATNDFKIASGMNDIIELDYKNPDLRKAMIAAMKYWVKECDIDGYRCDLAFWVELDFWIEARTELEKTKTLFWLAEADAIDNAAYYEAFDAIYTWTWMHKTEDFYKKNWGVDSLKKLLYQYDSIGGAAAIKLWFTSNHDENSWNGTEYEKYGDAAKAFAVHSFTWNGIPLIYNGQELPNLKRLEFFEKDVIAWDGTYQMADFYRILLTLRKTNKALHTGDEEVKTYMVNTSDNPNLITYLRKNGDKEVLVLLNMNKEDARFTLEDERIKGIFTNTFTGEILDLSADKKVELKGWGYRVMEK